MVHVRAARPDDAPRLRELDLLTWGPAVSPMPRKPPETPFFDDRTVPADVLVAVPGSGVGTRGDADPGEGDRACGFAILQQDLRAASHAHVVLLNGLAVDPAVQGRGVGRALLRAAQEETLRRGARKLTLRVLSTNTTARRLYASCGFVEEGLLRAEFHLDGRDVDDVLMACWP